MLTKQRKVANIVTKSIVNFTNFKYKFYLWGEFMELSNVIKNYPSLDILVVMNDLFGVTLD